MTSVCPGETKTSRREEEVEEEDFLLTDEMSEEVDGDGTATSSMTIS